ncbi:XRE family transcriptional regulator [Larkinella rosea]|uniref:LexA family transcriptional regulator n=1 Tax=Larkinella rosea TaxID=2025312 RepID=A0A3P1BN48_9BACT|nr:LexA family transcriptional regulator [Larkinella rosea]RRB02468.1 LexA family transcriptional regulator [Larkinella rosea]
MYLSDNLKVLRKYFHLKQDEVASEVGISRQMVGFYESGTYVPPIETLNLLATFLRVSLDTLVNQPLAKLSPKQFEQLMAAPNPVYRGSALQVREVLHSVKDDQELIEVVPIPASMGYAQGGYADQEFMADLEKFHLPLPGISPDRLYRLFSTEGDSMYPAVTEGSHILGEYVEDWYSIKSGTNCIFVLQTEGIVFKKAVNELTTKQRFELHSLNTFYKPYYVPIEDIKEIWKFKKLLTDVLPEPESSMTKLLSEIRELKGGQTEILSRLPR